MANSPKRPPPNPKVQGKSSSASPTIGRIYFGPAGFLRTTVKMLVLAGLCSALYQELQKEKGKDAKQAAETPNQASATKRVD